MTHSNSPTNNNTLEQPPGEIYITPTRLTRREIYHTTRECQHVNPGFHTITEENPRYETLLEQLEECQECRYESLAFLE